MSEHIEKVRSCEAYLMRLADVWVRACDQEFPHIRDMCKRSFLNTAAAQHFLQEFMYNQGRASEELAKCLESTFGLGQSRVVENAFQRLRKAADQDQCNRRLSEKRR